jgi:hypothetical protein
MMSNTDSDGSGGGLLSGDPYRELPDRIKEKINMALLHT